MLGEGDDTLCFAQVWWCGAGNKNVKDKLSTHRFILVRSLPDLHPVPKLHLRFSIHYTSCLNQAQESLYTLGFTSTGSPNNPQVLQRAHLQTLQPQVLRANLQPMEI